MKRLTTFFLASLLFLPSAFSQGSLTPPGVPAPTMKTLDQVEPRTPIAAVPFTISASGSYYVTGNLTAAGAASGITITASDVTLDLGGFALTGGGTGTTGRGIDVTGSFRRNICIRNGTVRGWSNGGVRADLATVVTVEKVRVIGNGGNAGDAGLVVGANSIVQDCVASNNSAGFASMAGIRAGDGSTVTGCVASSNGTLGFDLGNKVIVKDCAANGTVLGGGFSTGSNSVITGCNASGNTGGDGILAGDYSTVTGCNSSGNSGYGIISQSGRVLNCSATSNAVGGILATAVYDSTVRSNTGTGIAAGSVAHCHASVNSQNGIDASDVSNSAATANGLNGIYSPVGVVAFCRAQSNNTSNTTGVDIYAPGSARTGNLPGP
jgi:hypothetical protein